MAKALNIRIAGSTFNLTPTKVERKKLYGWSEIRVESPDGGICHQAGLNSDGVTIVASGCTKTGMLREDGQWMDCEELVAVDSAGRPLPSVASSFDTGIELSEKISIERLLDINVTSVYQLSGNDSLILAQTIGDTLYSFPFSYRGGVESSEAIIIAKEGNVFIIVGTSGCFDYIGLDEQGVIEQTENELADNDELDFSMF